METMKPCVACRSNIEDSAVLCKECSSYQDWRRFTSVSTPTLGLLVALVSVAGLSGEKIFALIFPARAKIVISAEYLNDGSARLTAINSGGGDAIIAPEIQCAGEDAFLYFGGGPGLLMKPKESSSVTLKAQTTTHSKLMDAFSTTKFKNKGEAQSFIEEMNFTSDYNCHASAKDGDGDLEDFEFINKSLTLYAVGEKGKYMLGGHFSSLD